MSLDKLGALIICIEEMNRKGRIVFYTYFNLIIKVASASVLGWQKDVAA